MSVKQKIIEGMIIASALFGGHKVEAQTNKDNKDKKAQTEQKMSKMEAEFKEYQEQNKAEFKDFTEKQSQEFEDFKNEGKLYDRDPEILKSPINEPALEAPKNHDKRSVAEEDYPKPKWQKDFELTASNASIIKYMKDNGLESDQLLNLSVIDRITAQAEGYGNKLAEMQRGQASSEEIKTVVQEAMGGVSYNNSTETYTYIYTDKSGIKRKSTNRLIGGLDMAKDMKNKINFMQMINQRKVER